MLFKLKIVLVNAQFIMQSSKKTFKRKIFLERKELLLSIYEKRGDD